MFSRRFGAAAAFCLISSAAFAQAGIAPARFTVTPATVQAGNATVAAAPGGKGLRVTYQKTEWPNLWFRQGTAYPSPDWSGYGGMALTLRNPDPNEKLQVLVRVDDSPLADGQKHCRTGSATLAPGETATIVFPLSAASAATGMRAGPPLIADPSARSMEIYGSALDEKNIIGFQIFLAQPKRPRDLDILAVRFLPRPDMTGIVDRWGQYAKADWPGKINSDAAFAGAAGKEKAWLAANPPLTDRDNYGGWKSGPTLKATGFFRTAFVSAGKEITAPKTGEALPAGSRWWLVTPTGHLFWSAGIDCVRPYAEAAADRQGGDVHGTAAGRTRKEAGGFPAGKYPAPLSRRQLAGAME